MTMTFSNADTVELCETSLPISSERRWRRRRASILRRARPRSALASAVLLLLQLIAIAIVSGTAAQYTALSDDGLASVAALAPASGQDILDFHDPSSILARILIPRAVGSHNLTLVHNLIKDHMAALSTPLPGDKSDGQQQLHTWELFEDVFEAETPYGTKSFRNLVFTHDPRAQQKIVIAAHTDSKYFPSAPWNGFVGATDSAVPCAIMLDVASTLNDLLNDLVRRWEGSSNSDSDAAAAAPDTAMRTTLQLVFFDGEEAFKEWTHQDSIYGAKHLADLWSHPMTTPSPVTPQRDALASIDVLILLDLLGQAGTTIHNFFADTAWLFDNFVQVEERLGQEGHLWEGEQGAYWDQVGATGTRSRRIFKPRASTTQSYYGGIEDDHLPFLAKGVPILHLIAVP